MLRNCPNRCWTVHYCLLCFADLLTKDCPAGGLRAVVLNQKMPDPRSSDAAHVLRVMAELPLSSITPRANGPKMLATSVPALGMIMHLPSCPFMAASWEHPRIAGVMAPRLIPQTDMLTASLNVLRDNAADASAHAPSVPAAVTMNRFPQPVLSMINAAPGALPNSAMAMMERRVPTVAGVRSTAGLAARAGSTMIFPKFPIALTKDATTKPCCSCDCSSDHIAANELCLGPECWSGMVSGRTAAKADAAHTHVVASM
mmetsp:Transcript_142244/g.248001  ORF Transcript_142244/g.248001 Transcript_142244/m.248001 type:complete len:258 (-) Transcript_142244:948-1721(-)